MNETQVHVETNANAEREAALGGRVRTCVGCGLRVRIQLGQPADEDLVRLVFGPNGEIGVDARGGALGRGAHVHARAACLERAARGGLARSTKGRAQQVGADVLARAIQEAMDRRIEGFLAAAIRSRQLARGADAVTESCRRGEAEIVVVARDAATAADLGEVRRAIAAGRAVAWGDEQRLGRIVTQDGAEIAVVAISSRSIARALGQAARIADACRGLPARPANARAAPPKRGGGRGGGRNKGADGRPRASIGDAGDKRRLSGVGSNVERGA